MPTNINIDIQAVLKSIETLLLGAYTKDLPAVREAVTGYVADAESRLSNLADGALSGELSYQYVVERLKEEATNIKDQLLSIGEILAADLQELANKAVSLFEQALKDAIGKFQG